MNPEHLFDVWAPADSIWTPWAKPVLFAQAISSTTDAALNDSATALPQLDLSWAPSTTERTAIILDVNGASSVTLGFELARMGYRPVPLFNTCRGPKAIVDVDPICRAILNGTAALGDLHIERDAPPVFLLDASRMLEGKTRSIKPGDFDNRWLVLPQDFPSANFLISQGIRAALIVQNQFDKPADDVAQVLRRWQDAGVTIYAKQLTNEAQPTHIEVSRPRLYRVAWQRVLASLGLRRNAAGGFGAVVPHPPSGG